MLLLGMSIFCSCNKEGGSTGGSSWIVGNWVVEQEWSEKFNPEKVDWYMEFSKDGFMTEYELTPYDKYAKFENGNLITPAGASWSPTGRTYQYTLKGDILHILSYGARIEKIDNDNFDLIFDFDFEGTYHRIKSMKTK